jgi:predicted nuclease with TOPRIM domain
MIESPLAFAYLTYLKERKAEMEERTGEINGSRSFEERVFARFDAIDGRFDSVDKRFDKVDVKFDLLEKRVVKLESKQYDEQQRWERLLSAIVKLRVDMLTNIEKVEAQLKSS